VSGVATRFSFDFDLLTTRIYEPDVSASTGAKIWRPITSAHRFRLKQGQTLEFRVESRNKGAGKIGIIWGDATDDGRAAVLDTVKYTSWDVDIDIDSNNNDALNGPEGSDWEEFIEDSAYGIGKIIYTRRLDKQLDHPPQSFTPIKIQKQAIDPNVGFKFVWNEEKGDSGTIRLWTAPSNRAGGLIDKPVENGGHLITSGRVYTTEQFATFEGVWVEAMTAQDRITTMAGVEIKAPNDRLQLELMVREKTTTTWRTLRTDVVKYLVSEHRDAFYPNLQFDRPERYWDAPNLHTGVVMRDSLISAGIYGFEDLPRYGQQFMGRSELRNLGMKEPLVDLLLECLDKPGLKLGLYRDYLGTDGLDYVLAFAGTEASFEDLACDVIQGLGLEGDAFTSFVGFETQYPIAMKIANLVAAFMRESGLSLRFTGHSLGGGLASAASIAANPYRITANTFNAAGLHVNTITARNRKGYLIKGVPAYQEAFAQYEKETIGGGDLVTAFNMRFDPLTLLQRYSPEISFIGQIPLAIGRSVVLEGPESAVMEQGAIRLRAALVNMPSPWKFQTFESWFKKFFRWVCDDGNGLLTTAQGLFYQHKMKSCHYGLMVEQNVLPVRSRKFDVFGYADPDK
jgi:hypothetical protein